MNKTNNPSQDFPSGMPRRVKQPMFEEHLLEAGKSIIESLPRAVFPTEQSLNDACRYLGWLEMWNGDDGFMQDEINVALYKINGSIAIDGRARDESVQSHVGIFFPRNASKDDKKRLERMQFKQKDKEETEENKGNKE
jgi:hypothetical protein